MIVTRAIPCGNDQTVHRTVDLLEGFSDTEIAALTDGLTSSPSA